MKTNLLTRLILAGVISLLGAPGFGQFAVCDTPHFDAGQVAVVGLAQDSLAIGDLNNDGTEETFESGLTCS